MTDYTPPIELDLVRWLAERDRKQREIGWDHATTAAREVVEGTIYERPMIGLSFDNPYRKA